MTREELICALERTASDNHRCFACGYEHNCGIHGCAINRAAATAIKEQSAQLAAKDVEIERLTTERDAAVTLVEKVNNIAVGAIEDGPYQDGEEAKIFSGIETITRTPEKQGKEG